MAEFRDLEILVAKIQQQLAPTATVRHNVSLDGRRSGRKRQIDVLVEQGVGQHVMRIIMDSKDYSRPVDLPDVEAFKGLLEDVGAHKGVLVCPRGFTASAKTRAKDCLIDLYSPVDTDPHKWQAKVAVPFLLDFRIAKYSFVISSTHPGPLSISQEFFSESAVYDTSGSALGTCMEIASDKWFNGSYPQEPREHAGLPIFPDGDLFIDDGFGGRAKVELTVNLIVEQEIYFGSLPIEKVSGFRDELGSGALITNSFTTGIFDPIAARESWTRLNEEAEAPTRPVIRTVVLG